MAAAAWKQIFPARSLLEYLQKENIKSNTAGGGRAKL